MNPESRLSEDGADEFEATLLRSARGDGASANRDRTLAALAIAGTAVVSGGVGASWAKGAIKALGSGKWLALVSLGVAAGIVGVAVYMHGSRPAADDHATIVAPVNAGSPSPALPATASPAPPLALPPPPVDRPAPPSPGAAAPRSHVTKPRPKSSAAADSLLQEVAIIDRAREELLQQDGVAATRTAEFYLARFPTGRLAGEAKVIRIRAALLTGGHAAAAPLAESFLRQHPDSPHAPELRKLLRAAASAGER